MQVDNRNPTDSSPSGPNIDLGSSITDIRELMAFKLGDHEYGVGSMQDFKKLMTSVEMGLASPTLHRRKQHKHD